MWTYLKKQNTKNIIPKIESKINTASSDSIFRILHAANIFEIKNGKKRSSNSKISFVDRIFIILVIITFGGSIIFAGVAYFTDKELAKKVSLVSLILAYFITLFQPFIYAWIYRKSIKVAMKNPFGILLKNSAATTAVDLKYLPKLENKNLKLLKVVALEIKSEKEFFERRLSLIVGAIEKVGLAPGLLAAFLSLNKLPEGISPWIAGIAYAIPILYLFAVMAHYLIMRLDRMNKLLDLAIAHVKNKELASPPPPKARRLNSTRFR